VAGAAASTGALGGAGGQSAFGTKAGDVFTRITVGVAAFWIGLCILSLNVLGQRESLFSGTLGGNAPQAVAPTTPPAGPPPATDGTPPGGEQGLVVPGQQPAPETSKPDAGKPAEPAADAAPKAPAAEAPTDAAAPSEPAGPAK